MIRLLLALFPKPWRAVYGEEFAALLEDTRLTPLAVLDVMAEAAKLHVRAHHRVVLVVAAMLVSAGVEVVAEVSGIAANVLWAPTTFVRAVALLAVLAPWVVLGVRARRHRDAPASA